MRPVLLVGVLVLTGCRAHVQAIAESTALPLTELSLDFEKNEEGRLRFTVDVPQGALKTVNQVNWQLWLGSLRFATGVEGARRDGTMQPDGSLRVSIDAPFTYRHLTWLEGSAYLEVALRAEVELSPSLNVIRFQGRRELLVHGKPVLDEVDE